MKILAISLSVMMCTSVTTFAEETREARAERMIKQLDSESARDRAKAAEEIGKMAEIKVSLGKPAVKRLVELLEDKDSDVRAAAAGAACRCDEPKEVVKPIIKLLKEEKNTRVKVEAIKGLGIMGESAREAVPTIREIAMKARQDNTPQLAVVSRNALESISGRTRQKN
jgi:HEAT repeat protein